MPVTLAESDLKAQIAGYARAFNVIADKAKDARQLYGEYLLGLPTADALKQNGLADQFKTMLDAVDELGRHEITVEEFNRRLDALYQTTNNEDLREFADQLLIAANAADESGDNLQVFAERVDAAKSKLRAAKGDVEAVNEVVGETKEVVDDAARALEEKAAAVKTYTDAIDTLNGKIPELAAQMKYLKDMTELNKTAWDGLVAAYQAGDIGAALQIVGAWGQAVTAGQEGYATGAVTGSLVDRIIGVESGGNRFAKNPNSSATGAGQFIESTWLAMFKKYFPTIANGMTNAAILEKRNDPAISREMVDLYAQENSRFLAQYGILLNDANLYLAHFLGPNGAKNILTANPNTPVSQILGQDQINANRSILQGKDAGQVIPWAQQKMGITTQQLAVQERLTELDKEALDLAEKQGKATTDRLSEGDFAIRQQELINAGKEREAEVQAAITAARAADPNITEAQIEQIRRQTEELYNLKNAVDEKTAAEERVNQLYTLRQQLVEQLKMAEENGDVTQAENLQLRITDVNAQLETAIQSAIAMWQAVGGSEADTAIAKLQTMGMAIQQNTQRMGGLGLSMQQWGGLAGSFADGLVGVLDSFAQAIANGEDAVASLGKAFLQFAADFLREIATMILKQTFFNMLQGIFPGLGGMMGHTGGIVGANAIGGGNQLGGRPTWMQNAFTYHTGGVAGLKPDEVSATLRVGEEVLTEEDPRHRNNLTTEASGSASTSQQSLKQVLVLDHTEIAGAMSSKAGESVILSVIKANRPTIKRMLG